MGHSLPLVPGVHYRQAKDIIHLVVIEYLAHQREICHAEIRQPLQCALNTRPKRGNSYIPVDSIPAAHGTALSAHIFFIGRNHNIGREGIELQAILWYSKAVKEGTY
jgi:hypothetical protein